MASKSLNAAVKKAEYDGYMKEIKRANQRLRQLEKSGMSSASSAYNYILGLADMGTGYVTKTSGSGRAGDIQANIDKPKFRTDLGHMTNKQITNMMKQVRRFNAARTSTVSSIKKGNKQRRKTMEDKLGRKLSDEEYYQLLANLQATHGQAKSANSPGSDYVISVYSEKNFYDMSISEQKQFMDKAMDSDAVSAQNELDKLVGDVSKNEDSWSGFY